MTVTAPPDDRPRIEAAARIAGEFVRLLDGILRGPRGRLLRRAVDADGRHLFSTADTATGAVWWPAGSLADVLRALRAAESADECRGCLGARCRRCHGAGFVPPPGSTLLLSPSPPTLPVDGDVADLWGWVRGG